MVRKCQCAERRWGRGDSPASSLTPLLADFKLLPLRVVLWNCVHVCMCMSRGDTETHANEACRLGMAG